MNRHVLPIPRALLLHVLLCSTGFGDALPAQATAAPDTVPAEGRREAPPIDRLLVCNKVDNTVTIFDPRTREELATLPTGEGPHEVAISPDGRTAVVTDYGAQKPGRTLTVVDVLAAKVTKTIDLVATREGTDGEPATIGYLRPHGCQFTSATRLLVTSERAHRLALVDLEHDSVPTDWTTPQTTMHMVAVGPRQSFAAATSIREGSVAIFDLSTAERKAPVIVPTGAGAEGLAINPKTGEVWVGNRAADTISVVDPKAGKVTDTLATGDFPFRVAFTPDGRFGLVSCAEGGDVQVFDAATKKVAKAISITEDGSELGAMPMGLCIDPEGARCYVACGRGEFVAVLDIEAGRIVDRLKAGRGPDGIGYARVSDPAEKHR